MVLGSEQVRQYRQQGWISPIDVMSPAEAEDLASQLSDAEAAYPDELHAEHRNNAHLSFPFLADLAGDRRIVDPVSQIIGSRIALWSTVLFIKEPDSAAYVSWHQDGRYMCLEPANFVTAWIALTPSTVESGCVSVIPGSHGRRSDHVDTFGQDNILTRGQQVIGVDAERAVHLELAPGQMSLHHPWLVHGSQPNVSGGRRVGVAMQSYLGADVRPVNGEHHVMAIAGGAPDAAFVEVPRPERVCSPMARSVRSDANRALSAVLYHGSSVVRGL